MRFVSLVSAAFRLSVPAVALLATAARAQDVPDEKAHCPICGAGAELYWDWVCVGKAFELEIVGMRVFTECDGVGTMVEGRETGCVESQRWVGGGGDDPGQCAFVDCDLEDPEGTCVVAAPYDEDPPFDEIGEPPRPDPSGGGAAPSPPVLQR